MIHIYYAHIQQDGSGLQHFDVINTTDTNNAASDIWQYHLLRKL